MKWLKRNWYILTIPLIAVAIGFGCVYVSHSGQKAVVAPQSGVETKIAPTPVIEPLATVETLLAAVNTERAKVGVTALKLDARLNQSAQKKADDMATNDYFDHVSPIDGRHGYTYVGDVMPECTVGGENIHAGTGKTGPTVYGWVDSKPHYKAMVNLDNTVTGFGIAKYKNESSKYGSYAIVEHFCQP